MLHCVGPTQVIISRRIYLRMDDLESWVLIGAPEGSSNRNASSKITSLPLRTEDPIGIGTSELVKRTSSKEPYAIYLRSDPVLMSFTRLCCHVRTYPINISCGTLRLPSHTWPPGMITLWVIRLCYSVYLHPGGCENVPDLARMSQSWGAMELDSGSLTRKLLRLVLAQLYCLPSVLWLDDWADRLVGTHSRL